MTSTERPKIPTNEPEIPGIEFHEGIAIFPFVPDSLKRSSFYTIEAGDLPTEADVNHLMDIMWKDSNASFYYYHGHDGGPSADAPMLAAREFGMIEMQEMERWYYKHPKFQRDYVRIFKGPDADFTWDWERDVANTQEYWRTTLTLSPRKREELDTWRKIELEELIRQESRKRRHSVDVFLSYASADSDQAQLVHDKLVKAGLKVFMAKKTLSPGDDFAEEIRKSLTASREIWVLLSPTSKASEWVITEWGAAWALEKKIVPILHRCPPESLSARLQRLHCIDLYEVDNYISSLSLANDATVART